MTIQYDPKQPVDVPEDMYRTAVDAGLDVARVSIQGESGVYFACLMRSVPRKGDAIMLQDSSLHVVEQVVFSIEEMNGFPYSVPLVIATPIEPEEDPGG